LKNICSVFENCGGCTTLNHEYEETIKIKEDKIKAILEENKIEYDVFNEIIASPEFYGYRNKMEYTFGNEIKDGPLTLGMKGRKRKYDVFYTKDCKIVSDDFNKIVEYTCEFFRKLNISFRNYRRGDGYLRHLSVRRGINTGEILINIGTHKTNEYDEIIREWSQGIMKLEVSEKIVSVLHSKTDSKSNVMKADELTVLYGNEYFNDKIFDLSFKISPFSFFQTNTKGAELLYKKVLDYLDEGNVAYDLFSGTGTIGLLMSRKVKKVYSVEIVEEAVKAAEFNAAQNSVQNIEFICGDVKDELPKINENPDFVVFDPPRAGLHKNIIKFLKEQKYENIIYVSCNPVSFAENMKELSDTYRLKEITPVDMFPFNDHTETVAYLVKK